MTENLDALLSLPLPDMSDNGFSDRVAARIELRRLRRDRLITEVYVGLVVLVVLVLPFTPLGAAIASLAFTRLGLITLVMGTLFLFLLPNMGSVISRERRP